VSASLPQSMTQPISQLAAPSAAIAPTPTTARGTSSQTYGRRAGPGRGQSCFLSTLRRTAHSSALPSCTFEPPPPHTVGVGLTRLRSDFRTQTVGRGIEEPTFPRSNPRRCPVIRSDAVAQRFAVRTRRPHRIRLDSSSRTVRFANRGWGRRPRPSMLSASWSSTGQQESRQRGRALGTRQKGQHRLLPGDQAEGAGMGFASGVVQASEPI